jgi:hypothetical protein
MRRAVRRRAEEAIVFPEFLGAILEKDSRASKLYLSALSQVPRLPGERARSTPTCKTQGSAPERAEEKAPQASIPRRQKPEPTERSALQRQSTEDSSLSTQSAVACSQFPQRTRDWINQPARPSLGIRFLPFSNLPTSMRRAVRRRTKEAIVFSRFLRSKSRKRLTSEQTLLF